MSREGSHQANGVAIAVVGGMGWPLAKVRDALPRRLFVLASIVLSFACNDVLGSKERVVTMDIASQRVACVGLMGHEQECLSVREHPDTDWKLFHHGIQGFQFEPGFEYTIRVAVRDIPNPPLDGPSADYHLLAVLRKVPA
jgi:hypothetical protein